MFTLQTHCTSAGLYVTHPSQQQYSCPSIYTFIPSQYLQLKVYCKSSTLIKTPHQLTTDDSMRVWFSNLNIALYNYTAWAADYTHPLTLSPMCTTCTINHIPIVLVKLSCQLVYNESVVTLAESSWLLVDDVMHVLIKSYNAHPMCNTCISYIQSTQTM